MLYIGVDLGTSAVKLLLMDENGSIHKLYPESIRCIFRIRAGQNKILRTGLYRVWKEFVS